MPRKKVKKFDYKITLKKAAQSALVTLLVGFLAYVQQEPSLLVLIPVVEAAKNFVKHYNFRKK